MTDKLQVQVSDGIARVLFNRPDLSNAMDTDVVEGLAQHFTEMAMDESVQVIVVSGKGKAFLLGGGP